MDRENEICLAPQFRVLTDAQIVKVYEATLECLQRTGTKVLNPQARRLLAAAGARVDGELVRIPPRLIEEALAQQPQSFSVWGRDGEHQLEFRSPQLDGATPGCVYFGPGPTCTYFVDPASGKRRKVQRGDPGLTALVCDALDNIDYVMGLGLIDDAIPALAPVYEFAEMVSNTVKPVLPWAYSLENVADIYQIALAVAGSQEALRQRPLFALFSTFQAPLVQTNEDLANAMWAAEHGIPIIFLGGATAGASAPITGAGTLLITLAGVLTGLAIFQLKKPGAAVCVGGVPQAMDLRTGGPAYGSPEMSLYSAALSDICRHLRLPFMGTAGASEAKVLDLQAAIESTMQVVLSGLSQATLVHDAGFLDCANIGSLEMLVMNNEIIGMTRRILRGIEVSDETLMLDLIDRVGPGGEFLSAYETGRRCRAEIWHPRLLDRSNWTHWEAAGSPTMQDRIRSAVREIVASHKPLPLPRDAADRIETVLRKAEARHQ